MGLIRVTQSTASSNKICYPFMKGGKEKIAFCPVWHKDNGTSFLPYGAKAIWKPDSQNETTQWNVRQYYATSKDTSTYTCPAGHAPFQHKFVSSHGFHMTNTTFERSTGNWTFSTTANLANVGLGAAGTGVSSNLPFSIYPVSGHWECYYGIAPALESTCMGNKATGKMVFGAVMMLPSAMKDGAVTAFWSEAPLGKTLKLEGGHYKAGPSAWWENGGYGSYSRQWSWQVTTATTAITPSWPSDGSSIFTGLKWLGHDSSLGGEMMFFQGSATVSSGSLIMPPHFYYTRTGVTNPVTTHIYDEWVAFIT